MTRSHSSPEAARIGWNALPGQVRDRFESSFSNSEQCEQARTRLAETLLGRLLSEDQSLQESHPRASSAACQRLARVIDRVCDSCFSADRAGNSSFAAGYGRQLLALTLPLTEGGLVDETEELTRLLERATAHEALAPLALERAVEQFAEELFREVGEELRAKALEVLGESAGPAAPASWVPRPDRLYLSVDHVTLSCARYLAGLDTPKRDAYGFDELTAGPGGRAKRVDQVTVKFDPTGGEGVMPELALAGSELKAKAFVALFALAAQAKSRGESGSQRVLLRHLLELMGFTLGRVTNSGYYWRYASQLTRHLLIDLPGRVVAMQVSIKGEPEPLVVFERLLSRSRPLDGAGRPLEPLLARQLLDSLRASADVAVPVLRRSGLEGFEFAVSDDLLEAHGIGKPLHAIEQVPVEVLSLKGPAFWLAWQAAFLRRWAKPPASGSQGKALLRAMEETGHLAAHVRGKRVRYKDALSHWWRDVGELAAMGLLEEPGVRLYAPRGGAWREISTELSRSLDPGSGRLSRKGLEEVRVVFQLPRWRVAQLEEARRRRRRSSTPAAGGGRG